MIELLKEMLDTSQELRSGSTTLDTVQSTLLTQSPSTHSLLSLKSTSHQEHATSQELITLSLSTQVMPLMFTPLTTTFSVS